MTEDLDGQWLITENNVALVEELVLSDRHLKFKCQRNRKPVIYGASLHPLKVNNSTQHVIFVKKLSYRTSNSNLRKHLNSNHPTVLMSSSSKAPVQSQVRDENNTNISSNRNENFTQAKNIAGAKSVYNEVLASPTIHHQQQQLKLTSYLPKKIEKSTNHNINNALLELFISDYQSFRIVEDKGFKKIVHALNPNYDLPNRKKILLRLFLPNTKNALMTAVSYSLEPKKYV
nr:unnamed protein product [Callosobruchus analis]